MADDTKGVQIARCVHSAYAGLPKKGKPQAHEWTVLAGLVVERAITPGSLECVALATGTKCLGERDISLSGLTVQDCHAEVLVRRLFKLLVLREVTAHGQACGGTAATQEGASSAGSPVCQVPHPLLAHTGSRISLHPAIAALWLYISDSPCGCCAEYRDAPPAPSATGQGEADREGQGGRSTGAKVVPGGAASAAFSLRTKSGRSDLPPARRTRSMCCSDKLARWCAVPGGWAGALLSHAVQTEGMQLSGIVVSGGEGSPLYGLDSTHPGGMDRQREALREGIWGRTEVYRATLATPPCAPSLTVVSLPFPDGRAAKCTALLARGISPREPAAHGKRGREEGEGEEGSSATLVPSGLSLLAWREHGLQAWSTSTITGATGRVGGSTAKSDPWAAASPVSKAKLWVQAEQAYAALHASTPAACPSPHPGSYAALKGCAVHGGTREYRQAVQSFHAQGGGFEQWLHGPITASSQGQASLLTAVSASHGTGWQEATASATGNTRQGTSAEDFHYRLA